MLNRNDDNHSTNSNNSMFDPTFKHQKEQNTSPQDDDFPKLVDPTIHQRFSRMRLRAQRGNHRAKQELFTIYFLLLAALVSVISLIGWQTLKNTNRIQKSKHQQIVETHAKDSVSSQNARHKFTEKYNSMLSDTDNTDIDINDTKEDLSKLQSYLPKIDNKRVAPYQKKYDNIKQKVQIQLAFNKFFVRNNPSNKEIKQNVTPNQVFAFNKKYNDTVQRIYDANNNDAFARRMNTDQNKLTSDANNLLSIYNSTTKLYSKLGSKQNNWSFTLNSNVIADRSQLNSDNLALIHNKSKNLKILSLSEITDKIKRMNYNWNNHLEFVNALLNNSKNAANNNYNSIAKMINQLQEEKDRKAMEERQNALNDLLRQSDNDDDNAPTLDNDNSDNSSSSSSDSSNGSNTDIPSSSPTTQPSDAGNNNNNGTATDDNQQTIVLPN